MIYPIVIYGAAELGKTSAPIEKESIDVKQLSEDMFATMYAANGVGLAAPQIGMNIRMFVIDASAWAEEDPALADFKKTFINPEITFYSEEEEKGEEGCLSLPGISEPVKRSKKIRIKYQDENFEWHDEEYENFFARVIQHEYDHLQGKVFIDRISPIRRQMNRSKISAMLKGKVRCRYNVKTV